MSTKGHHDSRTDAELIEAINAGETSAFEALYYRYREYVVRLAWRFTRNHDDALDALQETFAYLTRKFPGFRLSASMSSFLYPVVKHASIAICKKRKRHLTHETIPEPQCDASETSFETDRRELAEVMTALPEPQREVVLMRFVDEMTLAEISEALAIPLGTVKSRLHKALAALREDSRTHEYFEK